MPFTIGPKNHNIIDPSLKKLIKGFFSIMDWKGLYLSGGTCLSQYYFGHRMSYDMDLFTRDKALFKEASLNFRNSHLLKSGKIKPIREMPHLAQYLYYPNGQSEAIKIDLMLDLPVQLSPPLLFDGVWIDSLEDILSNKIGCLVQRNETKDYLDLYHLIPASHCTTKDLIKSGQKKDGGIDPLILAEQIEFIFKQNAPEKNLLGKTNWQDLQFFFKKIQAELLELIHPDR